MTTTPQSCYDSYVDAQTGLLRSHPFYYHFDALAPYKEDKTIPIAAIELVPIKNTFNMCLNPEFFPRFDLASATFVLAHEVLHVVYEDPLSPYMNHPWWNTAIDLRNNTMLLKQGFSMPKNPDYDPNADPKDPDYALKKETHLGLTPENVAQSLIEMWEQQGVPNKKITPPPAEQSGEWYLDWILNNLPPKAKSGGPGAPPPSGGSGNPSSGQPQPAPPGPAGNGPADPSQQGLDDLVQALKDKSEHVWKSLTPEEQDLARQMIADKVEAVTEAAAPPGNIAGRCAELIESVKPQENWERPLKKFTGMSGGLEMKTTMARYNKYRQTPKTIWKPSKKLLLAIDSSASMYKRWIARALGIIEEVAKYSDVDLMWVDTMVHECGPFTAVRKNEGKYEALGRGGTDMRVIFKWIKENKKKYDGIIIVSDLETPFPSREERNNVKTLWVGTKKHDVPAYAGEVLYVSEAAQKAC